MKATQVKCESCGAALDAQSGQEWISCEYCGAKSRIQTKARPSRPEPGALSRPRGGGGRILVLVLIVLPLVGIGLAAYFALRPTAGVSTSVSTSFSTTVKGALDPRVRWEGVGRALLADINGDDTADPIGRTRYVGDDDRIHLAAFDGKTGELIWESKRLGTYSETFQGRASLLGDTVLFGSPQGEVWAFAAKDGALKWQVPVGEKVKIFCESSAGLVAVLTLDEQLHRLRLADGTSAAGEATADSKGKPTCRALSHDRYDGDQRFRRLTGFHPRIDGMNAGHSWQLGNDGPIVVTGTTQPGTAVPKVAVFGPNCKLRWKSEVPGTDRLKARTGPPANVSCNEQRLVAVYWPGELNKPARVVAFKMKDGRRLWEQTLPTAMPVSAVTISDERVFVSTWGRLTAFDPDSGKQLYSVGWSIK